MFNRYLKSNIARLASICLLIAGISGANHDILPANAARVTGTDSQNLSTPASIHFAVIGDYGNGSQAEADVAALVKSWNPDFITTVGDNNYPSGSSTTIDLHIGQFFHEYIHPYTGTYGAGASTNQFFPGLGNHDMDTNNGQPYLNYFVLPGNERYYDFVKGAVHFFMLNSDSREPDGNSSTSIQANWLKNQLAASTSPWNFVFLHHAPYSSGIGHGSNPVLQWPFAAWGADAVLAGHEHNYERISHDGIPFFVNGLGGATIYPTGIAIPGSQVRYFQNHGAMLVDANESLVNFQFINRTGAIIDTFTLMRDSDTTGVFRPSNGLLYLKNSNRSGIADISINYGIGGDFPVVGDWDGDGDDTIGIYRNGSFYLRNSNTVGFADLVVAFGLSGDQPIAGDWDGDGDDTIGLYRPSTSQFLLRNSNSPGSPNHVFYLGNVGDVGIAGDWDGDGNDTTGVFRPGNGIIFLKNTNETGFADIALNYGIPGDKPVVGDWDNDGDTTIGVYRNGRFYLRNFNTNGFADIVFDLGIPGDMPIAGNWDGLP